MPNDSQAQFWTDRDNYGAFRRATAPADLLIVFVHGVLASPNTWRELPVNLLNHIPCDADVFAFAYPAFPWQRCGGISQVASDLRTALAGRREERGRPWSSIVFITHSTGGLVVKQLLADGFEKGVRRLKNESGNGSTLRYTELPDAIRCARSVLNVCVPHQGASTAATFGVIYPYVVLSALAWIPLTLVRLLSIGNLDWGFNRLSWQLRRRNPDLEQLDQRYEALTRDLDELTLPRPRVADFRGRADVAVNGEAEEVVVADHEESGDLLRGGHLTLKKTVALLRAMKSYFNRFGRSTDIAVADRTIERVFNLDRITRVSRLVSDVGDAAVSDHEGAQGQIADVILRTLTARAKDCRRVVLTGPAGVGKSVVLRNLARRVCVDFHNQWTRDDAPLMVGLPLQQVTLGKRSAEIAAASDAGRQLFDVLTAYWTTWVNGLLTQGSVELDWLASRLRDKPTILLLDGIDEFFTNNPGLGLRHLRAMFDHIERLSNSAAGADVDLLLGVRDSYPGYRSLASSENLVFHLLRLTTDQATGLFPGMAPIFQELKGSPTLDLLLTPLVLSWLGPRADRLLTVAKDLRSRRFIIHEALVAIIEESKLPPPAGANHAVVTTESWHEALVVLGWLYFRGLWGDAEGSLVGTAVEALDDVWKQHELTDQGTPFTAALRMLRDPGARLTVLSRTVFLPTGSNQWRFAHREWQDYLAACYLARCVQGRNVDEMRHVAFTQAMFQIAGELLDESHIDEEFVSEILKKSGLVSVNFAGLVGNSYFSMTPQALGTLLSLESLRAMTPTARLVAFTAVGFRALKSASADRSREDLKREALHAFMAYGAQAEDGQDAITRSLAWCNHKALAAKFGVPPPVRPWPGLGHNADHEADALRVITAGPENGLKINPPHQSLQVAMAQIQEVALYEPDRPVSTMHYLYYVSVAHKYRAHVSEVSRTLPSVFSPESKVAEVIRNYHAVPELWQLFETCKTTYSEEA